MDAYEGETVRLQRPCPLCQGTMEEGFLLDQGRSSGTPAEWIVGAPQWS